MNRVNVILSLDGETVTELQQHMARLTAYYEADVAALGRISAAGEAQVLLEELILDRLERLSSAEAICDLLAQY